MENLMFWFSNAFLDVWMVLLSLSEMLNVCVSHNFSHTVSCFNFSFNIFIFFQMFVLSTHIQSTCIIMEHLVEEKRRCGWTGISNSRYSRLQHWCLYWTWKSDMENIPDWSQFYFFFFKRQSQEKHHICGWRCKLSISKGFPKVVVLMWFMFIHPHFWTFYSHLV